MNIENQEVSIQCGNSECNLYKVKIMIDMYHYKRTRKLDDVYITYYELPYFYCAGCFRELSFTMKEKK